MPHTDSIFEMKKHKVANCRKYVAIIRKTSSKSNTNYVFRSTQFEFAKAFLNGLNEK